MYIIIGVVGGLVLLVIIICCCVKCNRDSDARRHQAAVRAANSKPGAVKMAGAPSPRPPVSPRGQPVQPVAVAYVPAATAPAPSNRPPVRPE